MKFDIQKKKKKTEARTNKKLTETETNHEQTNYMPSKLLANRGRREAARETARKRERNGLRESRTSGCCAWLARILNLLEETYQR